MPTHPYTRENGYDILAGHDVTDKRGKTTRYMLVHNATAKENKAAILTAAGSDRKNWTLMVQGKTFDITQLFEKLDGSLV